MQLFRSLGLIAIMAGVGLGATVPPPVIKRADLQSPDDGGFGACLNQKRRLQALEVAIKQSSYATSPSKPSASEDSRMEGLVTPLYRQSDLMLNANSSDISNSAPTSDILGEAFAQPKPWPVATGQSVIPGLDECHTSIEVPDVPEPGSLPHIRTPLHIAIQNKNAALVQLLLREGADVARQDHDGSTALHLAVESGQEDIVSNILTKPVDRNASDYSGRTALFRAIEAGDHAVAKLLLDSASDPNIKDIWGDTAIHLAVKANSETLTALLLEYGAHIDP
ncbi:hypothetical protein JX265_002686 [Neoarthrinium moseri]|uniref:Ankyrin repeat protein n=1 Tax=Neoarthrinium moseri TaxID=1658444 RepID=A0A9Q0ATR0_9PEZI|nr:hypothetical protein JX265_002686 [Neoarthrinium moseri]